MRIEDRDGHFVRGVPVSHPSGDTVRMTIHPAGLPNPNGHSWIAAAEQWVTETGFCAQVCDDRIRSGVAQGDAGPIARTFSVDRSVSPSSADGSS